MYLKQSNFHKFLGILPKFDKEDKKYIIVTIVKRKKDNPEMVKNEKPIRTYIIRSSDELKSIEQELKTVADIYGARVYATPQLRSLEKLQKEVFRKMSTHIVDNIYVDPEKTLYSEARNVKPENPVWVIDIDNVDKDFIHVEKWLLHEGIVNWEVMPTVNGIHILSKPFNSKKFVEDFPHIDLHKNGFGTLLYFSIKKIIK